MTRDKWLEMVRALEGEPHDHQWQVDSGSTDGYFRVYCWCCAWAWQDFNGRVYGVIEPLPELRTRQFEKRLWNDQHSTRT